MFKFRKQEEINYPLSPSCTRSFLILHNRSNGKKLRMASGSEMILRKSLLALKLSYLNGIWQVYEEETYATEIGATPEPRPFFEDLDSNVTVQLGAQVYFHCRVQNLQARTVSYFYTCFFLQYYRLQQVYTCTLGINYCAN